MNTNHATFAFNSTEPGSKFACSLDGRAFAACSSPATFSGLLDEEHQFAVRATDRAGHVDASPATRVWTVDTHAPKAKLRVPDQKLGAALKRGLRLRIESTEAATWDIVVRYRKKTFGTASATFGTSGRKTVYVRPSHAARSALKHSGSATLKIRVEGEDLVGNKRVVKTRAKLKR